MVRTRTPSPVTLEDPVGDRRADSVMGRDMLCAQIWRFTQTGHITHIKSNDVPAMVGTSSFELKGELDRVIASIGRPKFDSIVRGVMEPWTVFKETEKARGATPGTLRIARKTLKKKAVEHTEDVKVEGVEESVKPAPAKKRRAAPDEDEDGVEEWQKKPAARSGGTKRHRSEDKWSPSDAAALVRALGGGTWSPPDVEDAPAASNGDVPKMLYTKEDHDNINMVHIIMRRDIIEVFEEEKSSARRIGIRCKFCKHLPAKERANLHSIYPEKIGGIYRACTVRFKKHIAQCQHIPRSVHRELRKHDASVRGSKKYWEDSARAIGLVESGAQLIFCPNMSAYDELA